MSDVSAAGTEPASPPPRGIRALLRNPWFWAAIGGLIVIPVLRPLMRRVPAPPAVKATLPAWELIDHAGRPLRSADLDNRVYLIAFVSTACDSKACRDSVIALRDLQRRFDKMAVKARVLALAVDPAHDTPDRLRAFARSAGIDLARFTFVTGPPAPVRSLLDGGLRAHLASSVEATSRTKDPRLQQLVLVDGDGAIRGTYTATEKGTDEAFHRAQHVMSLHREWR